MILVFFRCLVQISNKHSRPFHMEVPIPLKMFRTWHHRVEQNVERKFVFT